MGMKELNDMEMITQGYDPTGKSDKLIFKKKNKLAELTEVDPNKKFNYS